MKFIPEIVAMLGLVMIAFSIHKLFGLYWAIGFGGVALTTVGNLMSKGRDDAI